MKKNDIKSKIEENLEEKYPGFKDNWKTVVNKLGYNFVNFLKERVEDEESLFNEVSQFKITVVLDNNFIFSQLKSMAEKNEPLRDSFIYRLAQLKSLKIYAPPKLEEELYDKIETVLKVNKELAKKYAKILLQHIEIKEAYWIDEWKKANNLIGKEDEDDVPYLALALDVNSHSIMSYDKVFHQAGITQVWDMQDTSKVITNYNKGFMSFFLAGSATSILNVLWEITTVIFKVLGEIVMKLITYAKDIIAGTVTVLSKVPPEIAALSGFFILLASKSKKRAKRNTPNVGEVIKKSFQYIGRFLKWLIEFIGKIMEVFVPVGIATIEFAVYFAMEYTELQEQLTQMENNRIK